MAFFQEQASAEGAYFKADQTYRYKAEKGIFAGWDAIAKAKIETSSIDLISILNLQKLEAKSNDDVDFDFTSNLVSNIFEDDIHITQVISSEGKSNQYRKAGIVVWDKARKVFVNKHDKQLFNYDWQNTLCVVGMLPNGQSIQVEFRGVAKMDLTKLDPAKSNKDKIELVKKGCFLSFSPSKELTKVGTGRKAKNIHLVDVNCSDDIDKLTPEQEEQARGIYQIILKEREFLAGGFKSKEEDLSDVLLEDDDDGEFKPKRISVIQGLALHGVAAAQKNSEGFGNPLPRWTATQVQDYLSSLGYKSSAEIPAHQYQEICDYFENNPAPKEPK